MITKPDTTAASGVHQLTGSSPSTGTAPRFDPLATGCTVSGYKMARFPNRVMRSPEQRLEDLNAQYDSALHFYEVTGDVEDAVSDDAAKENAEHASAHAVRILSEIQEAAYGIPATTIRMLGLKTRIMSGAKHTWWDPTADDQDRDARVLIEDILALAGMDRIHSRDFEFSDLLPGYAGPEKVPSDSPVVANRAWTEDVGDAAYDLKTHPEAGLMQFAGFVQDLVKRENAAHLLASQTYDASIDACRKRGVDPASRARGAVDREFGLDVLNAMAMRMSEELLAAIKELVTIPARTPEGLCAKAGVLREIEDSGQEGYDILAGSIADDAVWIGTRSRFQLGHLDAPTPPQSVIEPAARVA